MGGRGEKWLDHGMAETWRDGEDGQYTGARLGRTEDGLRPLSSGLFFGACDHVGPGRLASWPVVWMVKERKVKLL